MNRIPLILLTASLLSACRSTVLPVHEEPLHRLVHAGDDFQVLDVTIPSGVVSQFHLHDAPITYVSIDPSPMDLQPQGGEWRGTQPTDPAPWERGEVAWTLEYAQEPLIHRVTTVGPDPFRVIAVINRGSGTPDAKPGPTLPGELEQECAWFGIARQTLVPGEKINWTGYEHPTVCVLVSEGQLAVEAAKGAGMLGTAGDFFVREKDVELNLRNAGEERVELVFVELR